MRIFLSVCRVLVWVLFAVTLPLQLGAVLSISMGDQLVNPTLLILATALMFVSVILFFAAKRGKLIWLITAAVAGVLFIVVAVWFKDAFAVTVTSRGMAGLSWWKAIYRHMSPTLIPLCMFPVFWNYHTDRRAKKIAEANRLTPSYFDQLSTDETAKPRKAKRSVRKREESEDLR